MVDEGRIESGTTTINTTRQSDPYNVVGGKGFKLQPNIVICQKDSNLVKRKKSKSPNVVSSSTKLSND